MNLNDLKDLSLPLKVLYFLEHFVTIIISIFLIIFGVMGLSSKEDIAYDSGFFQKSPPTAQFGGLGAFDTSSSVIDYETRYNDLLNQYNELLALYNSMMTNSSSNIFDSTQYVSISVLYKQGGSLRTGVISSSLENYISIGGFDLLGIGKYFIGSLNNTLYYNSNNYIIGISFNSSGNIFIKSGFQVLTQTGSDTQYTGTLTISDSSNFFDINIDGTGALDENSPMVYNGFRIHTFDRDYYNISNLVFSSDGSIGPYSTYCTVFNFYSFSEPYDVGYYNGYNDAYSIKESYINDLKVRINELLDIISSLRAEFNNYKLEYNQTTVDGAFNNGVNSVNNATSGLVTLFTIISGIPITILNGLTGFQIWGVPVISFIVTLLLFSVVIWLIRRFI